MTIMWVEGEVGGAVSTQNKGISSPSSSLPAHRANNSNDLHATGTVSSSFHRSSLIFTATLQSSHYELRFVDEETEGSGTLNCVLTLTHGVNKTVVPKVSLSCFELGLPDSG